MQLAIFAAAAAVALSDDASRLCCDQVLGRSDETSAPAAAIFASFPLLTAPAAGATQSAPATTATRSAGALNLRTRIVMRWQCTSWARRPRRTAARDHGRVPRISRIVVALALTCGATLATTSLAASDARALEPVFR